MVQKPICQTAEVLKAMDFNNHWNGTNQSGFNALPSGWFNMEDKIFLAIGDSALWWCSEESEDSNDKLTNAWSIFVGSHKETNLLFGPHLSKGCGLSVRCIKAYSFESLNFV